MCMYTHKYVSCILYVIIFVDKCICCIIVRLGKSPFFLWLVKMMRCQWENTLPRSLPWCDLTSMKFHPSCYHREDLCPLCFWYLQLSNGKGRPSLPSSGLGKQLRSVEQAACAAGEMWNKRARGPSSFQLNSSMESLCWAKARAALNKRERKCPCLIPFGLISLLERFRCLCIGMQSWHSVLCRDNAEQNTSPMTAR